MARTIDTPVGTAPIIPVLVMSAGAYLCWFGIHYWRSDTAWPTDPIKAVLTGNPMPTPDKSWQQRALASLVAEAQARQAAAPPTVGGAVGPGGTSGNTAVLGPGGAAVTSGTLTNAQIKQLWIANGGSPSSAPIAAAIAEAESSGRTGITSPNPDGGTNVGLWQLDTKGVGAGYSVSQLSDPATNARVTVMHTSNGSNWNPWETWHTGAYRQFLTNG